VPRMKALGFIVVALRIDEQLVALSEELHGEYPEGAGKQVTVNKYERSASARRDCLTHHGTSCTICRFDFARVYGEDFAGYIHVHHLVPLSTRVEPSHVNPVTDLAPVCPNCHAAIHYGGRHRSLDEVHTLILTARERSAT
jgi:5-methylcytosine-specific restriction protein A